MNLRHLIIATSSGALLAGAIFAAAPAAIADGGSHSPSQAETDGAVSSSAQMATWADYSGGVASRPFVTEMSVTANGTTTPIVTNGTTSTYQSTGLTTVIAPTNLCRAGQSPQPGVCYATPNRISLMVGVAGNDGVSGDLTGTLTSDAVIDLTINMNSFGDVLRWSYAQGNLQYWSATGIGADNALVHIKLKPGGIPFIPNDGSANGCTATPINSCEVAQATGSELGATLMFSLDDTLNPALTGAVFASQNAIFGYLEPGGTSTAPMLDLQIASSHLKADGSPQTGELQVVLPSNTLLNMYGVQPSDAASFFSTTRTGSTGTNTAPTYTPWTATTNGTDGLFIDITDITFSVPVYQVARSAKAAKVKASTKGSKATVTLTTPKACKTKTCEATVYTTMSSYSTTAKNVGKFKVEAKSSSLTFKRKSASNYSVTVRLKKGKKLVTTGAGSFLLQ